MNERKRRLLQEIGGRLEAENTSGDADRSQALDLMIVTQDGRRTRAKIIVANNRLIELASAHGSSDEDAAGESRFWNSFRLVGTDSM